MKFLTLFLTVTLPLYIADQVTKFWVVSRFSEDQGAESIPVIPGHFELVRVHNQGVAWGFGNGSDWAPVVFLIVPLIALSLFIWGWRSGFFASLPAKIAGGLFLAGVFGNLTDRLIQGSRLSYMHGQPFLERLKAGYVVDFLKCTIPLVRFRNGSLEVFQYNYPVFNVADSCVFVGAILLFISGFRDDLKKKKQQQTAPAAES